MEALPYHSTANPSKFYYLNVLFRERTVHEEWNHASDLSWSEPLKYRFAGRLIIIGRAKPGPTCHETARVEPTHEIMPCEGDITWHADPIVSRYYDPVNNKSFLAHQWLCASKLIAARPSPLSRYATPCSKPFLLTIHVRYWGFGLARSPWSSIILLRGFPTLLANTL